MRHDYLPAIFADRSFDRIEFYGRVMEWHTRWTDEVRTLYHATTYRWPFVARLDAKRRAHAAQAAAGAAAGAIEATPEAEATTSACALKKA